jgi:organic radical activating enzyme
VININARERLEEEVIKLKRLINCVKDHPEIKPHNCCYQADTIELEEYLKDRNKRIRKIKAELKMRLNPQTHKIIDEVCR